MLDGPLVAVQRFAQRVKAFIRDAHQHRLAIFLVAFLSVFGLIAATHFAYALPDSNDIANGAISIFGAIVSLFMQLAGWLFIQITSVLIDIAQYNSFVTSPVIATGWILMRDVTNMFYVFMLLYVAFGTMVGYKGLSVRDAIPIMINAVVVNFSRTICGLLIDFSQVVMLTFVNGFSAAAGGNFAQAFQITKLIETSNNAASQATSGAAADRATIVVSLMLSVVLVLMALGVVTIITCTLAFRIVKIWMLVVTSPFAFSLRGSKLGFGSGYYSKWWKEFTGELLMGPALAFFLWLALVSVQTNALVPPGAGGDSQLGPSRAFSESVLQTFIIGVALLLGGLKQAGSFGGTGASMVSGLAKTTEKAFGDAGKFVKKQTVDRGVSAAKTAGKVAALPVTLAAGGIKSRATDIAENVKLGALRYAATGGAREGVAAGAFGKALQTATGGPAARKLQEVQGKRDERLTKASSFVAKAPKELQDRYADGWAVTNAQKARKREALKARLEKMQKDGVDLNVEAQATAFENAKKQFTDVGAKLKDKDTEKVVKEYDKKIRMDALEKMAAAGVDLKNDAAAGTFFNNRKELESYSAKNRDVRDALSKLDREHPELIVNARETGKQPKKDKNGNVVLNDRGEPVEELIRDNQIGRLQAEAKRRNAKQLSEMTPKSLTDEFLMYVDPNTVLNATKMDMTPETADRFAQYLGAKDREQLRRDFTEVANGKDKAAIDNARDRIKDRQMTSRLGNLSAVSTAGDDRKNTIVGVVELAVRPMPTEKNEKESDATFAKRQADTAAIAAAAKAAINAALDKETTLTNEEKSTLKGGLVTAIPHDNPEEMTFNAAPESLDVDTSALEQARGARNERLQRQTGSAAKAASSAAAAERQSSIDLAAAKQAFDEAHADEKYAFERLKKARSTPEASGAPAGVSAVPERKAAEEAFERAKQKSDAAKKIYDKLVDDEKKFQEQFKDLDKKDDDPSKGGKAT